MYWDVTDVYPVAARELAVSFADGLSGVIRIEPSFCTGVFEALRDDEMIERAEVHNGLVVWQNGLDLAPDTMYREIKHSPDRRYVISRKWDINPSY